MMKYKGYMGSATFDSEANTFCGTIIGIKDVITFQGQSVDELVQAFKDSVNDYLAFCEERGEKPDKPYSGKFNLRVPPELHATLDAHAKNNGESLNSYVTKTLAKAVGE